MLPVLLRSGDDKLIPGGRREGEGGSLSRGGWARQDSVHRGLWVKWNPRPVLLDVYRWMKKDHAGNEHWYDLQPHHFIPGLVAHGMGKLMLNKVGPHAWHLIMNGARRCTKAMST